MSKRNKDGPRIYMSPEQAREALGRIGVEVTHATIVNWCRDRGWGRALPSGRWMVFAHKVKEFVDAQNEAAEQAGRPPNAP